tara:strand:+ start:46 stop:537 length:492 start_codon:yes stop_codon:yes gene_type:complete
MPTSVEEANSIMEIMDDFLDADSARELTARLEHEVGQGTDNDSLKVSLEMLKELYKDRTGSRKKDLYKKTCLYSLIAFHHFVITVNIVAFFILPFLYPLLVWMPLNSFILTVTFSREICPLTRLENYIRTSLGMPRIGGFIGHYLVRPVKNFLKSRSDGPESS